MNGTGLFGSSILEVAIGLFFVYLLLSLICSSINELLASFLKWRAKNLQDGIHNLICDPALSAQVMAHPLIKALGSTRTEAQPVQQGAGRSLAGKPSYIPSRVFALALLDSVAPAQDGRLTVAAIRNRTDELVKSGDLRQQQIGGAVAALIAQSRDPRRVAQRVDDIKQMVDKLPAAPNTDEERQLKELVAVISPARTLQEIEQAIVSVLPPTSAARQRVLGLMEAIQTQIADVECDLGVLQQQVATWFDDAMGRASGIYKRKTQVALLGIALVVSGTLGADSLRIVRNLSVNPTLRTALVDAADRQTGPGGAPTPVLPSPAVTEPGRPEPAPTPASGAGLTGTTGGATSPSLSSLVDTLSPFSALFGYDDMPAAGSSTWWTWLISRLVGIIMTVFAVSLGAPFWFDVLNKVANIRGAGQRPEPAVAHRPHVSAASETPS